MPEGWSWYRGGCAASGGEEEEEEEKQKEEQEEQVEEVVVKEGRGCKQSANKEAPLIEPEKRSADGRGGGRRADGGVFRRMERRRNRW